MRRGDVNRSRASRVRSVDFGQDERKERQMKITKAMLVSAVAALGLAATAAQAQHHGGGHWSGGHAGAGAHWGGHGGHWSGGHWGGHWGGWHGWWGPRVGFYFGVPLYWGWPYWWDGYYYPYYAYPVYPYAYGPAYYGPAGGSSEPPAETTQVPRGPGAPTQEPAYRNYCQSAKAYYPKVTSCPEGWRFEPAPSAPQPVQ
jgi:hypothetical protein